MRHLLVLALLALAGGLVRAEPAEPAAPQASPAPADPQAQFDAAFDTMTRGDFAAAAAGFRAVAAAATDPELRGAANQLGRLADDLARRGARLTFGGAPADGPGGGAPGAPGTGGVGLPGVRGGPAEPGAGSEDDEPDAGRASFVVTTTLASLYSGLVLVDLLDIDDVRSGTLIVMGSTATGLVGSLYGTRGRTMTGGMADAWSLGMGVGAANALLLAAPLGLYDATSNAREKVLSLALAGTWGGASAGLLAASRIRPTRAQVSVMGTIAGMGLASTLLSIAIVQPDSFDGDTFATITAIGLDAGLGLGAVFASKLDWSLSRARYVGLSAILGAVAGGGTSLLLFADGGDEDTGRVAAGITLGGLWGGFLLGRYLTRDMPPDRRFRAPAGGVTALVAPTVIRGAAGAAVVGAF